MQLQYDVFISYSRLNQGFADDLYRAFEKVGIRVSMNREYSSIGAGQTEEALDKCRAMILLISGPSLRAPNLQLEVAEAFERDLPILPVQIQELKAGATLPPGIEKLRWIDAKDQSPRKLSEIVAATRQMLAPLVVPPGKLEVVAPVAPPTPTPTPSGDKEPKFDIFLSHSSKDKAQADLLWHALEKRGHNCWIAPHSIKPSEPWPTAIKRGVKESALVVLLFSAHSDASGEVLTELHYAQKFGVPVSPVRIEDIEAETLDHYIWNLQWISAVNPPLQDQLETVLEQIDSVFERNKVAEAPRPVVEEHEVPTLTEAQIEAEIAATTPALPPVSPADSATLKGILSSRGHRTARLFTAIRDGATDIEATDRFGQTSLHYAAREMQGDVLRLLLERGANADARDQEGASPLHHLVLSEKVAKGGGVDVDLARLLILRGAQFDAPDKKRKTPLDYALRLKPTQTTQFRDLIEACDAIKWNGKTPNEALHAALAKERRQSQNILDAIALGADDVAACDAFGRTALHWATRENAPELVQLLLERGANPNAPDNGGQTPLLIAHKANFLALERALLAAVENQPATRQSRPVAPPIKDTARSTTKDNEKLQAALSEGKHDVFISYSHRNTESADLIYDALTSARFSIWMDRDGIKGGLEWEREIQKALNLCRVMLLIISQSSMESENVQDEIATALMQGLPILPVKIEGLNPGTIYPMRLNRIQSIDATEGQLQRKLDEIVAATRAKLGAGALLEAPVSQAEATKKAVVEAFDTAPLSGNDANAQLQAALESQGRRYKAEIILRAIRSGATDFSFTDQRGRTALHWAAKEADTTAMRIALQNGADPNAVSDEGVTPLAWARENILSAGVLGMVEKLLKEFGATG